jgi:hypothetical protein
MSTSYTTETTGRRTYVIGNTYAVRDALRAAGAHWDADRKAWWMGDAAKASALVASLGATAPAAASTQADRQAPGTDATIAGKATYKGKTYYVAGRVDRGRTRWDDRVGMVTSRDGDKVLLYSRDGSMQFWAPLQQFGARVTVAEMGATPDGVARVEKTYDRPQTIGRLKAYADRAKRDEANGITPELRDAYRHGWDGKIGSPSYYSSGAFDEIDE